MQERQAWVRVMESSESTWSFPEGSEDRKVICCLSFISRPLDKDLLGGQASAWEGSPGRSLCLTKSSACGRLWQFAHPRPLSLLHLLSHNQMAPFPGVSAGRNEFGDLKHPT